MSASADIKGIGGLKNANPRQKKERPADKAGLQKHNKIRKGQE